MGQAAKPPVRIGLVGAGAIMELSHAPSILRSAETELAAVYDVDRGRAAALAEKFGIPRHTTELASLVDGSDVDAVIVATPNVNHAEAVLAAAGAGKHVLCEKPLSVDIRNGSAMVAACAGAGVVLQVGFNQRYWRQVAIAKALIDSGFIGTIHGARSVYSERWNVYPAATRFRYDLSRSGGATIIDLTVHRIDLLRHLVGDMAAVFAELTHSAVPDPVDDNVWILARFANGARGCLSSDRFSPAIADGTDIYGSEGTIHIATETQNPFHAAPLAVYTEKPASELPDVLREAHYPEAWWKGFQGGWISVKPPRSNPYDAQLAAFVDSIRNGTPPLVSGEDGLRAQEVVQASYLSMRDGGWVGLPLPDDAPLVIPAYR
jgi:predicted dehydrogenase